MHFDFAEVFLTVLVTLVIGAGLLAWAWMFDEWRHGRVLLPQEPHYPVVWEGIDLVMIMVVWLVVQVVCNEAAVRYLGAPLPKDPAKFTAHQQLAMLVSQFAGSMVTFVVGLSLIKLRNSATLADLGFDARPAIADVKTGAVAFAAIAPVIFAIQALLTNVLPYEHPVKTVVEQKPSVLALAMLGVSTIIVAPLTEEFFFRVLLQGWFEKIELVVLVRWQRMRMALGPQSEPDHPLTPEQAQLQSANLIGPFGLRPGFLPIIISSVIFALMHYPQGPAMVPLFVFALVLGTLYQRTHRILPSFTVHLLLNGISMLMLFAGDPTNPQVGN